MTNKKATKVGSVSFINIIAKNESCCITLYWLGSPYPLSSPAVGQHFATEGPGASIITTWLWQLERPTQPFVKLQDSA